MTKYSKVVDQHREMGGAHAHSDQYYIDKLDAAIAPHPQLGAYSSELDMFDTRFEKRLQDILRAAGADRDENTQTAAEEVAESYEDQANQSNQQASNNGALQSNQQRQGNSDSQGSQTGSILWGMMSANQAVQEKVDSNGVRWRQVHSARIEYRVSRVKISDGLALCDSGANGGMAGSDCRIMEKSTTRSFTVTGVTDGVIDSPLCTASAVVSVMDEDGKMKDVVLVMHQYTTKPDGHSIHSKVQLEHMGLVVHDTPAAHGGYQMVITREGYIIPLQVKDGLCYMKMRPPTDEELSSLPHIIVTSDDEWDQ